MDDNIKLVILVSILILFIILKHYMKKKETNTTSENFEKMNNNICEPKTDDWYYQRKSLIEPMMYLDNTSSWFYYDRDRQLGVSIKPDTQTPMDAYDQNKFINAFKYDFCGKTNYRKSKAAGRMLNTKIPYLN